MGLRKKRVDHSEETKARIIEFWRTNNENSMAVMAEKFGGSKYQISQVIDKHLAKKSIIKS